MRCTELAAPAQSLISVTHIATSRVMGACLLRSGFAQAAGAERVGAAKQFPHLARLHVHTRMEVPLLGELSAQSHSLKSPHCKPVHAHAWPACDIGLFCAGALLALYCCSPMQVVEAAATSR